MISNGSENNMVMMNARTEDERENYRKTIDNLSRN